MFNKNICLISQVVFLLNIVCCATYVNYEIFEGFDIFSNNGLNNDNILTPVTQTNNISTVNDKNFTFNYQTSTDNTIKPSVKPKPMKVKCPENESPLSLGTYEIPTQQDLVLFTKRILLKMFNNYHQKTLFLLKDIKEATRATEMFEKKCRGQYKQSYKNCVKRISKKCVAITKDLVGVMEGRKQSVAALLEGRTCNMTDMQTDPIQLVIKLAMDAASLEFALPAFLRLIGGCSAHCFNYLSSKETIRRPSRHMTDQDLVIKHFLTRKNYIQLIKDSDTHV